ncbi:MAG TPA: hypothetical protein EYO32_09545 [Rhodospirillales bacterium]|nr:hypothetical protein [Rhodospirillales bacterium]
MSKIVSCEIGPYPKSIMDYFGRTKVTVTLDDGERKDLFSFYPDEISFSTGEFIGLTEQEAHSLHHKKDVAYLRS